MHHIQIDIHLESMQAPFISDQHSAHLVTLHAALPVEVLLLAIRVNRRAMSNFLSQALHVRVRWCQGNHAIGP